MLINLIIVLLFVAATIVACLSWSGYWGAPGPTRRAIRKQKRRITDHKPSKRLPLIGQSRGWLEKIQARNADDATRERAVAGTDTDETSIREAAERAGGLRGFSRILVPLEVVGQYVIAAAWHPNYGLVWNLFIAVLITGAIWALIFWAFRAWHDPDTTTRSIRVARWTTAITATVATVGGLIYATGRFALPTYFATFDEMLFVSLIALAEVGPIAAGAATFGAWAAEKPVRMAAVLAGLKLEKEELNAFAAWLDEQTALVGRTGPGAAGGAHVRVPHLIKQEGPHA